MTERFLAPPPPVAESLMALHGLGAIDNTLAVTALGRQMLKFPLAPAQARVLTASVARGCTADVLDILSLVNDSPIFLDPLDKRDEAAEARKGFAHRDGDHLTLLNVLRSYEAIPRKDVAGRKAWCRARFVNERNLKRAIQARDQMRTICEREGVSWHESKGDDAEPVLRCLVEGMFTKCAVWSAGEYRQVVGNSVRLASSSVSKGARPLLTSRAPPPTGRQDPPVVNSAQQARAGHPVRRDRASSCAPCLRLSGLAIDGPRADDPPSLHLDRPPPLPPFPRRAPHRSTRPIRTRAASARSTTRGWPSCPCSTRGPEEEEDGRDDVVRVQGGCRLDSEAFFLDGSRWGRLGWGLAAGLEVGRSRLSQQRAARDLAGGTANRTRGGSSRAMPRAWSAAATTRGEGKGDEDDLQ